MIEKHFFVEDDIQAREAVKNSRERTNTAKRKSR